MAVTPDLGLIGSWVLHFWILLIMLRIDWVLALSSICMYMDK